MNHMHYGWFYENGFFSAHSLNEHYLSLYPIVHTQVAEVTTVFRKHMVPKSRFMSFFADTESSTLQNKYK